MVTALVALASVIMVPAAMMILTCLLGRLESGLASVRPLPRRSPVAAPRIALVSPTGSLSPAVTPVAPVAHEATAPRAAGAAALRRAS